MCCAGARRNVKSLCCARADHIMWPLRVLSWPHQAHLRPPAFDIRAWAVPLRHLARPWELLPASEAIASTRGQPWLPASRVGFLYSDGWVDWTRAWSVLCAKSGGPPKWRAVKTRSRCISAVARWRAVAGLTLEDKRSGERTRFTARGVRALNAVAFGSASTEQTHRHWQAPNKPGWCRASTSVFRAMNIGEHAYILQKTATGVIVL